MKNGTWAQMELKSFGPNWPKACYLALDPQEKTYFSFLQVYWIHLKILIKMRSCL